MFLRLYKIQLGMNSYFLLKQVIPSRVKVDSEFPKDFINTVKSIFKQLFRVIAHIYHSHFDKILHFSGEGHLNTLTAHFLAFSREFELLDKKELTPLQELLDEFDQVIIK